jgi:ATP-dependent Clp protease adaptor protein ClpS
MSAKAFTIMMNVHRSGLGVAGIFTRDVADTKVRKTQQLAAEHEFPLLVTMEPEPESVNQ